MLATVTSQLCLAGFPAYTHLGIRPEQPRVTPLPLGGPFSVVSHPTVAETFRWFRREMATFLPNGLKRSPHWTAACKLAGTCRFAINDNTHVRDLERINPISLYPPCPSACLGLPFGPKGKEKVCRHSPTAQERRSLSNAQDAGQNAMPQHQRDHPSHCRDQGHLPCPTIPDTSALLRLIAQRQFVCTMSSRHSPTQCPQRSGQ